MFKSSYLNKEEWDMYLFYPEENDKFEKVFKDACWEYSQDDYEVDVDIVRDNIEWNNKQYIWIAKDSQYILETFVDDVGYEYFDRDLDICWEKWESETEINENTLLYMYDEDNGGWCKVDDEYKMLMY